jgi:alcohol dehydrogenase class IV
MMNPLVQFPRIHLASGARAVLAEDLAVCGIERPLFVTDRGPVRCGVLARAADRTSAADVKAMIAEALE